MSLAMHIDSCLKHGMLIFILNRPYNISKVSRQGNFFLKDFVRSLQLAELFCNGWVYFLSTNEEIRDTPKLYEYIASYEPRTFLSVYN